MTDKTEKTQTAPESTAPVKAASQRFPRSVVAYMDALLEIQRDRMDRELAVILSDKTAEWPALPSALNLPVEGDEFSGSGWSAVEVARGGTPRRWMKRVATVLFAAETARGGTLTLEGGGYVKRDFVDDLTVWLDNYPIKGKVTRQGRKGWRFDGRVPAVAARPFHVLMLQTSGFKRRTLAKDSHASLALSRVTYTSA